SLKITRHLESRNPGFQLFALAANLNKLGCLYGGNRPQDSEQALVEALKIYRRLEASNPGAYLAHVAEVLNNLGGCYRRAQKWQPLRRHASTAAGRAGV